MDDLGARLKEAREARGVALRTIATRTKISVVALEALERNDFTRLPGGIFGRAFVRAYAVEIGLDPETTVADFQTHLDRSEREAAERNQIRVDITEDDREFLVRQQRALRVVQVAAFVLVVVILTVVAWFAQGWWTGRAKGAAVSSAAGVPGASEASPSAPSSGGVLSLSSPVVPETPEPPVPAPATIPNGFVVEFMLTGDCWVVVSVDGGQSMSQLLKAGDSRRFEAAREVFLDFGNAAAAQLRINGRAAKPLGGAGVHVQKTIRRDNLAAFLP